MSRPRMALIALSVVALLSLFVSRPQRVEGQTYNGKTLSEWFYGIDGHPGRSHTLDPAKVAFQALGTNGVPFLIAQLNLRDSSRSKVWRRIYRYLPLAVKQRVRQPIPAFYTQRIALMHLRNLSVFEREPFAGELLATFFKLENPQNRIQGYDLFEHLAIRLDDPEEKKEFFLRCLQDEHLRIQLNAAIMLAKLEPENRKSIPTLMLCLTNQTALAEAFGPIIDSEPIPLAPKQEHMLRFTSQQSRSNAFFNLRRGPGLGNNQTLSIHQHRAYGALSQVAPEVVDSWIRSGKQPEFLQGTNSPFPPSP